MRRWAALTVLAALPAVVQAQIPGRGFAEPYSWGVEHDSRAGTSMLYQTEEGYDLMRVECVLPSPRMPLLDAARPYNRVIKVRSHLAREWLTGREVFAMVLAMEGWRRVDVLAIQDYLMIGPKESERGMIAMQLTGQIKIKIIGNTQAGVVEQDVTVLGMGVEDALAQQDDGCRDHFS